MSRSASRDDVLKAIRAEVENLMGLGEDVAAGRVPLSNFDADRLWTNVMTAALLRRFRNGT